MFISTAYAAGAKTILKNGGTFESTVHDPETGAGINRYWL